MGKNVKNLVIISIFLIIALNISPVQAGTFVPLCQAGTPFDSTKYLPITTQSDPMVFQCNWNGTGMVYISGDKESLTGVYADDGYTLEVQPDSTLFDAPEHWAHQHPVVNLTSGMKTGLNTFNLTIWNWQGLSMSYGSKTGIGTDQVPYIVQVISEPNETIIPLCQAGTPFDATKYDQNTPQSDSMIFQCNWNGTGMVYISGDKESLTGVYADDGYTLEVQPDSTLFDAPEHWANLHPAINLTRGMKTGLNTFNLTIWNWPGVSMSYGSKTGIGTDQVPFIVQDTS